MTGLDWVEDSTQMFLEHWKLYVLEENNFLLMKTVLKFNHVWIEKVRAMNSQLSYTDVMMKMKLLEAVTPPFIYQET